MTRKKGKQRQYYRMTDTTTKFESFCRYLLFAHAFTGCDTTSAIHNFGQTSIFQTIAASPALQSPARKFYEKTSPEEIETIPFLSIFILHLIHYLLSENQNTSKCCYPIVLTSILQRYLHLQGQLTSMGYESTIRSKYRGILETQTSCYSIGAGNVILVSFQCIAIDLRNRFK